MSTSGIEVLADHRERVLQLDQAAHRQILALHGDDHLVGGRQRVDRQQPEARRRVDADEVVVLEDRLEGLLQRALAADHRRHRDLRAGEVDRGAGDVDLALADHLADRDLVHEHVVHRFLERVRVDALGHRQVALRVHVDAQHAVPLLRERGGEVERRRRLGHPALLVGERDDLGLAFHGWLRCSIVWKAVRWVFACARADSCTATTISRDGRSAARARSAGCAARLARQAGAASASAPAASARRRPRRRSRSGWPRAGRRWRS